MPNKSLKLLSIFSIFFFILINPRKVLKIKRASCIIRNIEPNNTTKRLLSDFMSPYLLLLLVFPLGWPFVARALFGKDLSPAELAINVLLVVGLVAAGYKAGTFSQTADVQVLNSEVTSKAREEVSCSHSYSCNCRQSCSGSGKNSSCSTTCDTCYEHPYDVDWVVKSAPLDDSVRINRIDRRGMVEPPRFTATQVGEPYSKTQFFVNYVKGAPDSLFNTLAEKAAYQRFEEKIKGIKYPSEVYDYYRVNHAIAVGATVPDLMVWNAELARMLAKLGPLKKSNVVIVFTNEKDRSFAQALRTHWLGAKLNDTVIVVGTSNYPALDWVDVFAWSDNRLYQVQLRDRLAELATLESAAFTAIVAEEITKGFKVKSAKDFQYLESQIEPPLWVIVMLMIVGIAGSVSLSIYFKNNDPFRNLR